MTSRYEQFNEVTFEAYIKTAIDNSTTKERQRKNAQHQREQNFSDFPDAVILALSREDSSLGVIEPPPMLFEVLGEVLPVEDLKLGRALSYTGVICNGEAQSQHIPELQIIDQETFDRAQKIMGDRTTHHADTPLNQKGKSLLVGNVFCGHCRNRLTLTTSGRKTVRKDGTTRSEVRSGYQCNYNVRHPGECDGQSGYGVTKLDGIMERIVRYQLSRISAASGTDLVAEQNRRAVELAKARCNVMALQLAEKQRELSDLQAETIKVIRGQSKLSIDLLNELVEQAKAEIQTLSASVEAAKEELDEHKANADHEQQEFDKIKSWADLYDTCSFAAKK